MEWKRAPLRPGTRDSARYPAPTSAIARRNDPGSAPRLLVVVQVSSEPARQALRQACCFARKQASPPALLVVVRDKSVRAGLQSARSRLNAGVAACPGCRPFIGRV